MKSIIKFVTDDGVEHVEEEAALEHERLCDDVHRAESHLLPRPTSSEFSNGVGFVQQTGSVVIVFQRHLIRTLQKTCPTDEDWSVYLEAEFPVGNSYMGRLMDDAAPRVVRSAWWRVMCIDEQFREYGQPYFAIQADKRNS